MRYCSPRSSRGIFVNRAVEQVLGKLHTCLNRNTNRSNQGIQTGDVVKASIDASGAIVGYVNGVEVIRVSYATYPGGNPTIGFLTLCTVLWLSTAFRERGGQDPDISEAR